MKIEPASPILRRNTAIALGVIAVLLAGLLYFVEQQLPVLLNESLLDESPEALTRQLNGLIIALAVLSLPMAVPLWLMWSLANRAQKAERFPPPGTRVVRDTPIREGREAQRYARFLKALVLLLALAIAAIPVFLFLLLRAITGS